MDDFTAIDFETANRDPRSACAVGLAVVRGGAVVETFASFIQPLAPGFDLDFTALHGIGPATVRDAPDFAAVWPEIERRCGAGLIAAHYAPFDLGVIEACRSACRLPPLPVRCMCTVALSRAFLPELPNHKLPTMAHHFGIPLRHHDATSDAVACAEIALRIAPLAGPRMAGFYQPLHLARRRWR